MLKTKTKWLIGGLGTYLMAGCHGPQKQAETGAAATASTQATAEVPECYAYRSAQDTVRLELRKSGDVVTGQLAYQLAEKDRNTGTFSGQMHGDTLFADYTFQSEGVASVREVVFLKKADGLVEGYGPVAERGGKQVFNNHSALTFTEDTRLTPVDCQP